MSNTAETTTPGQSLRQRVEDAINLIRPAIQEDGGDVELVDVTAEGTAKIRFLGACCGCPGANMTLHGGIRRVINQHVPEVKHVVLVR